MNYKPDESQLVAYLYGELSGEEKSRVEQYLASHPEARKELDALTFVTDALRSIGDKEVIAPPIVLDNDRIVPFWNTYFSKALLGIAASLTLIILVAKWSGLSLNYSNSTLTIGFGITPAVEITKQQEPMMLTNVQVQEMIDASLLKNNQFVANQWEQQQQDMQQSIRTMLASKNDDVFNQLVSKSAQATEEQIRQFALTLQADNARMIKDYLTLNSSDQRKYIETLLVDFAKYLEAQQQNDLNVLQARVNKLEQNTDLFKYETEKILTSIISSVDNPNVLVTRN